MSQVLPSYIQDAMDIITGLYLFLYIELYFLLCFLFFNSLIQSINFFFFLSSEMAQFLMQDIDANLEKM